MSFFQLASLMHVEQQDPNHSICVASWNRANRWLLSARLSRIVWEPTHPRQKKTWRKQRLLSKNRWHSTCQETSLPTKTVFSFAKNQHHFLPAKKNNNISYISLFQTIRFLSFCCCFLGFLHFRFPAAGDTQSPTALCQTARTARTHLWRTHLCRRFLWQP